MNDRIKAEPEVYKRAASLYASYVLGLFRQGEKPSDDEMFILWQSAVSAAKEEALRFDSRPDTESELEADHQAWLNERANLR